MWWGPKPPPSWLDGLQLAEGLSEVVPQGVVVIQTVPEGTDKVSQVNNLGVRDSALLDLIPGQLNRVTDDKAGVRLVSGSLKYEVHEAGVVIVLSLSTNTLDVDDSPAKRDWGWKPDFDLQRSFNDYLIPAMRRRYKS